jgi:hypothetical protein
MGYDRTRRALVVDDGDALALQVGEAVPHGLQLIGRVSYPVQEFTPPIKRDKQSTDVDGAAGTDASHRHGATAAELAGAVQGGRRRRSSGRGLRTKRAGLLLTCLSARLV